MAMGESLSIRKLVKRNPSASQETLAAIALKGTAKTTGKE